MDGLRKNKYHDLMLIFSVILAFFMLIIVSTSSIDWTNSNMSEEAFPRRRPSA